MLYFSYCVCFFKDTRFDEKPFIRHFRMKLFLHIIFIVILILPMILNVENIAIEILNFVYTLNYLFTYIWIQWYNEVNSFEYDCCIVYYYNKKIVNINTGLS